MENAFRFSDHKGQSVEYKYCSWKLPKSTESVILKKNSFLRSHWINWIWTLGTFILLIITMFSDKFCLKGRRAYQIRRHNHIFVLCDIKSTRSHDRVLASFPPPSLLGARIHPYRPLNTQLTWFHILHSSKYLCG